MGQTNFFEALGWAVINSLWQMALLWIIFQLFIYLFKFSARLRASLAAIFLISGFCWFLFTLFSIWNSHPANISVLTTAIAATTGHEPVNDFLRSAIPIASFIYLGLLILPVAGFARNYRYVQLIRNHGLEKIDVKWRIFVQQIAAQMGIRKPVHIWVSELICSPVTIGYLKPVILVPLAALNNLSTQQLEAVLLHELAHIRRYDYLVNLIINIIRTILYFNPFVKSFVRTIEKERERSCDEMVMQFQYGSYEYASALLLLERQQQGFIRSLIVAASGKRTDLLHRIEFIIGVRKKPMFSFNRIAGIFAGFLCIIILNALLLTTRPATANHTNFIARAGTPFYLFTGSYEKVDRKPQGKKENENVGVIASKKKINSPSLESIAKEGFLPTPPEPSFASILQPVIPELAEEEERQVKEAVANSRKLIENAQWKKIEQEVADAMTSIEKERLRKDVKKELSKYDWKSWEDRLKVIYDKVDWEKINGQLQLATTQISLDSLLRVYTLTNVQLNQLHRELAQHDLKGIPDSDISMKQVEQCKVEVQKQINRLTSIKNKKVIHL